MISEQTQTAIAEIIRGRRTIEKFRHEPPPQDIVRQAIELACWAPNHKHTEPWRFHLFGPESTARLMTLNTELVREQKGDDASAKKRDKWSAVPRWLAITCDISDDPVRAEEDYAACCCAAQNLALHLWAHGIGMKWSTGAVTRSDEFARLLGFGPGERKVVGLFSYGYPDVIPESRRQPLDNVLVSMS